MKYFLIKGIFKDKSRSLLPIIVVSIGVFLTVLMHSWVFGVIGDSIEIGANFNTGHVKITTKAYAEDAGQLPNDLALLEIDELNNRLKIDFPRIEWVDRIRFGALIDVPNENGETRAQAISVGWGIDLLNPKSSDIKRFNLESSLKQGKLPQNRGEALITLEFAQKFDVKPGDIFTLIGTTMDGSMSFSNYVVSGTVTFGVGVLDRGAIIIDIEDARNSLAMIDGASEILGFLPSGIYEKNAAEKVRQQFQAQYYDSSDEFSPYMQTLHEQDGMGELIDYSSYISFLLIFIFVFSMSIVLWNAGLLGGLRRYSEFGVRLALGEYKSHIYGTLLFEALIIGTTGSLIGTFLGLTLSYYIHSVGIDMSSFMPQSSIMMPTVVRTHVTSVSYYLGFIPGILSIVLGNALAGIGIYKRNTAKLFNELEV